MNESVERLIAPFPYEHDFVQNPGRLTSALPSRSVTSTSMPAASAAAAASSVSQSGGSGASANGSAWTYPQLSIAHWITAGNASAVASVSVGSRAASIASVSARSTPSSAVTVASTVVTNVAISSAISLGAAAAAAAATSGSSARLTSIAASSPANRATPRMVWESSNAPTSAHPAADSAEPGGSVLPVPATTTDPAPRAVIDMVADAVIQRSARFMAAEYSTIDESGRDRRHPMSVSSKSSYVSRRTTSLASPCSANTMAGRGTLL